ncbi:MAG: S24/S26 family peptidase [Candidatus Aminicenantes bacterium]|nr:S24/S26 family peptidase [Candidatus Aminicenantes bacterium]
MNYPDKKEHDFHMHVGSIFIEQLGQGNSIRMIIKGQSMFPFLRKGDAVTVKPIALKETRIGDIIACRRGHADSSLTVHRLLKKKKEFIVTKGDANRHGDPPIFAGQIWGKVIKIERDGKIKNLETNFHRLFAYLIVYILWSYAAAIEVISHPICFFKNRFLKK